MNFRYVCLLVVAAVGAGVSPATAQDAERSSASLLMEIVTTHRRLSGDPVFQSELKMLSTYLEEARTLSEDEKIKIYHLVLDIMKDIETKSRSGVSPGNKSKEGESRTKPKFEAGAAIIEVFKSKSMRELPPMPVIRAEWKRDLHSLFGNEKDNPIWIEGNQGGVTRPRSYYFFVPQRANDVGEGEYYVARFSFYLEAKETGQYGFLLRKVPMHRAWNVPTFAISVGGKAILEGKPTDSTAQGVVALQRGFHQVEILVGSCLQWGMNPGFQLLWTTPNAFDAAPITKDMLLLRREEKPETK